MSTPHLLPEMPPCLIGFEHVNRFWDRQQMQYIAKILPGEFYVTKSTELIGTTLGSCVSACIWDYKAGIGGMNHFMLPITDQESGQVKWGNVPSDATRYGNYAMEHLINEIINNGGNRRNLLIKVFGGGKVMKQVSDVGKKNAAFVSQYISDEKLKLEAEDLGDVFPRKLIFDPKTGKAMVKKLRKLHNNTIINREKLYQDELQQQPIEGDIELFD